MTTEELVERSIHWCIKSEKAIQHAGGDPKSIIELFSPELLVVLIRNGLVLSYNPSKEVHE
jgi:hypothetical protein